MMPVAYILNIVSIVFEVCATLVGVKIALEKKKTYGWYLAITFAIWTFADVVKFMPNFQQRVCLVLPNNLVSSLFFVAALSVLIAVWNIYREK